MIRLAADGDLLRATRALSRLIRLAEAQRVQLAGEISRRSVFGDDASLAARSGAKNAVDLLANEADLGHGEASGIVRMSEVVRPRQATSGESLPPTFEHVAVALALGALSLPVAEAIRRCLTKLAPKLTAEGTRELEEQLVEAAEQGWTVDEFCASLKCVVDRVDEDGARPREDELNGQAQITQRKLENGLTRWILDLDPLTNGFFETALAANGSLKRPVTIVTPREAEARAEHQRDQDRRPLKRRRVDALRLLSKKVVKVDPGDVAGTAVTLLVTLTEQALRHGLGAAEIVSTGESISATTARMLAADARIVPVVLGGTGQVLDLGAARRYFSAAQRHAMALRDGGCVGPGCTRPPSDCDAAHIRPAGYGSTSLDNGVLLCWHCHKLLDLHGWQLERDGGMYWWTPPPWGDPSGRRRPGGRIHPIGSAA